MIKIYWSLSNLEVCLISVELLRKLLMNIEEVKNMFYLIFFSEDLVLGVISTTNLLKKL